MICVVFAPASVNPLFASSDWRLTRLGVRMVPLTLHRTPRMQAACTKLETQLFQQPSVCEHALSFHHDLHVDPTSGRHMTRPANQTWIINPRRPHTCITHCLGSPGRSLSMALERPACLLTTTCTPTHPNTHTVFLQLSGLYRLLFALSSANRHKHLVEEQNSNCWEVLGVVRAAVCGFGQQYTALDSPYSIPYKQQVLGIRSFGQEQKKCFCSRVHSFG